MGFEYDICWCGDSYRCKNTECFRHFNNRPDDERIFTCACLMWTEACPMHNETEEVSDK